MALLGQKCQLIPQKAAPATPSHSSLSQRTTSMAAVSAKAPTTAKQTNVLPQGKKGLIAAKQATGLRTVVVPHAPPRPVIYAAASGYQGLINGTAHQAPPQSRIRPVRSDIVG